MNNLDKARKTKGKLYQILKTYQFGYCALLKFKNEESSPIVNIINEEGEIKILTRDKMVYLCMADELWEECLREVKITGYLYAGELAGDEPIPEGQKFRVKETGEILEYDCICYSRVHLKLNYDGSTVKHFDKSEIEPYFD